MKAEKVYELVKKVPSGKVTTYGAIAEKLGGKNYSRAVGKILNQNSDPEVPCHRVVYANGTVGGFRRGKREKIEMLRKEGIEIKGERIVNSKEVLFAFQ